MYVHKKNIILKRKSNKQLNEHFNLFFNNITICYRIDALVGSPSRASGFHLSSHGEVVKRMTRASGFHRSSHGEVVKRMTSVL